MRFEARLGCWDILAGVVHYSVDLMGLNWVPDFGWLRVVETDSEVVPFLEVAGLGVRVRKGCSEVHFDLGEECCLAGFVARNWVVGCPAVVQRSP